MGANSKIEWTHHTFNPWVGCTKISPACAHCYAEAWAKRSGLVQWGDQAERRHTSLANWGQPRKWNENARREGVRRRVFCASLADVFEDRAELIPWRTELFNLIDQTRALDWLLLTKRPENIQRLWPESFQDHTRCPNIWLGATVENQEMADRRIPALLKAPAKVRFLSCEPLLGRVNLAFLANASQLHWVIAGGESGQSARPMHPDWARLLRDQCQSAGAQFHFKQWGEWIGGKFDRRKSKMICQATELGTEFGEIFWTNPGAPKVHLWDEADHYWTNASARIGKKLAGRVLDGQTWDQFPEVSQ